jgi:hypothetical protein
MTALNKQALRSKSRSASAGEWIKESGDGWEAICSAEDQANGNFIIAHFEGPDARANREFSQAANPATVLALLDDLEAKDKSIGFLKDHLAQLANFNPDWDRLEAATDSLREHMAKLSAAEKRIAELEARTVTLPPKEYDNGTDSQIDINAGFANRMWQKCYDAIRAAGIGVKGD